MVDAYWTNGCSPYDVGFKDYGVLASFDKCHNLTRRSWVPPDRVKLLFSQTAVRRASVACSV